MAAGLGIAAGGCRSAGGLFDFTDGAPMHGFAAPKLPTIRVGVVGMGGRGKHFLKRAQLIPGIVVTAICDNVPKKIEASKRILADAKKPPAREYLGEEAWKALCEDPNVDVVYNTTPWSLHVPVQLAAMRGGKHVFTEVPSAFTVDECWELVETSEKTRRHCMQLENCCYGEVEMLTFNLARLGMLGKLTHAEGAYIHDLRGMSQSEWPGSECWRFDENRDHGGNRYPTHGLVPLCLTMDVNRGDRMDYIVSIDSKNAAFADFMAHGLKKGNPRAGQKLKVGDMNTSLIRTVGGKTIMLQHTVSVPRPYSRLQRVQGTRGIIADYPYRIALEGDGKYYYGSGAHAWWDAKRAEEIRQKYKHPLWKTIGEIAKKSGGHGGMDYIQDARWSYCLRMGLPLDTSVYDLATTGCLCELTETSATNRSRPMDVPDFTRGAWKTAPKMDVVNIDLAHFKI